eukprot:g7179.t1
MSQFKRQASGVNGFLQGMSVGQSKSESVAARRAEFERMKREQAEQRIIEEEGHKNAHYLDKEAQEKLGEAGTYKEWTIVYDPQSGENYYYNNFSGACVWEEPDDFKISTRSGKPIAAIKLWAARRMQAIFRGKKGRMNVLFKRAETLYQLEEQEHDGKHEHGDWVEAYDPHHHSKYYYNHATHEVSWDPPEGWVYAEYDEKHAEHEDYSGTQSYGAKTKQIDYSKAAPVRMWRPKAATKIQKVYRGHLARRHVRAIREHLILKEIRKPKKTDAEKLPPEQDFFAAGDAAKEEINRLGKLMHENNDRVKRMEETISNHKHVVEVKDAKIAQLQKRLDMEQEEVATLEKRLKQEEDDFEEIVKLTKAKEKEIEDKNSELKLQMEKINGFDKELDRHKVIIRRQEKQIDTLTPETEDVCLSARSFSEDMMISLRDEAIDAKEKQIALLNQQNENLLENLDSLESEIHKMQKDLVSKERIINKKQRYGEHLEHKIDKLERDLQKKGGEEAAIEVTNRQNAQLLQLLQVHEAKTEELEKAKTDLEENIAGIKKRMEELMHQSAEHEASNVQLEAENVELKKKLSTGSITWEGQRAQMEVLVEETKKTARVRIESMQEELRTRREKQYSLLERLQAAEESMRSSEDECERLRETVNVVQERMYELDAQLIQAKQWRAEDQGKGNAEVMKWKGIVRERDSEIGTLKEANVGIKRQLEEMAATVLQLVEKAKVSDNKLEEEGKRASGKRAQLEALQQRVAGLIKEGMKEGKARVQAETTVKALHDQIKELRKQNKRLVEDMKQNLQKFEEKEEHLKRRMTSIQARLTGEQRARRASVVRIIDRRITTDDEMSERERRDPNMKTTIDLSNIGITDDEIHMIGPLFGKEALLAKRFETLNLSYNRLGDNGARQLSNFIRSGTFLQTINVSGNTISGEGIRALAEGVSGSSALGVQHVYVHKDGKVQGLGARNKAWKDVIGEKTGKGSGGILGSPKSAETVLTVDIRNNVAPETATASEYEIKAPQSVVGIVPGKKAGKGIFDPRREEKKRKEEAFLKKVYGGTKEDESLSSKEAEKSDVAPNSSKTKRSFFGSKKKKKKKPLGATKKE